MTGSQTQCSAILRVVAALQRRCHGVDLMVQYDAQADALVELIVMLTCERMHLYHALDCITPLLCCPLLSSSPRCLTSTAYMVHYYSSNVLIGQPKAVWSKPADCTVLQPTAVVHKAGRHQH